MILGRRSLLVKLAVELPRRRCRINRGKALLSRSNRQRGEDRANSRHVLVRFADRDTTRETYEEYDVDFKAGRTGEEEGDRERSR